MEAFLEYDEVMKGECQEDIIYPLPTTIDINVLTGHASIRKHSNRYSVKDSPAVGRMYAVGVLHDGASLDRNMRS